MKQSPSIVGAVATYIVVELSVLFSPLVGPLSHSEHYRYAAFFAELVLIPGLAALFCLILYGRRAWIRRSLSGLTIGVLGAPLAFICGLMILLAAITARQTRGAGILVALLLSCPLLAILVFLLRITKRWSIEHEAARWLSERRTTPDRKDRHRELTAIRIASALPSAAVLLIFLFFFQLCGFLIHVAGSDRRPFGSYSVAVPNQWEVLGWEYSFDAYDGNGDSPRLKGVSAYRTIFRFPELADCASWSMGIKDKAQTDRGLPIDRGFPGYQTLSDETLRIGQENLRCVMFRWDCVYTDPSIVSIDCSAASDLHATFLGPKNRAPEFLQIVRSIQKAE